MKVGDKIDFYLFGTPEKGIINKINKETKTVNIAHGGVIYPNVETIKDLPNKTKDKKPWYILKK